MTVVDYEPLVHAALLEAVSSTSFPFVSYFEGHMVVDPEVSGRPASVTAKAESATFDIRNQHRSYVRDRVTWIWVLELTFKGEVSLGRFERNLLESPPRVLRDRAAGRDQQVTLNLIGSAYSQPPEGQPAGGTRATYRFDATLTPN